jgi:hypothetical protein
MVGSLAPPRADCTGGGRRSAAGGGGRRRAAAGGGRWRQVAAGGGRWRRAAAGGGGRRWEAVGGGFNINLSTMSPVRFVTDVSVRTGQPPARGLSGCPPPVRGSPAKLPCPDRRRKMVDLLDGLLPGLRKDVAGPPGPPGPHHPPRPPPATHHPSPITRFIPPHPAAPYSSSRSRTRRRTRRSCRQMSSTRSTPPATAPRKRIMASAG